LIRILQFPFGVVELDTEIEQEGYDELLRSILYYEKYLLREAA
jgi:hypothetical protein